MQMPGRTNSSALYRYGFNGKENDNDVKGTGNQQDYGMRIYDPRLGRFLSVDPITKDYPMLTPYQFASNRPIDGIDFDGLEYLDINKYGKSLWVLSKFERLTADYTIGNLQIRNLKIHKIILNHPDNWRRKSLDDPGEPNDMVVKKRSSSNKAQNFSRMEAQTARREGAADVVGGIIDAIKWAEQTGYNLKYKAEHEYAAASMTALDKADNLVRAAVENPTFPKNLQSTSVKTDLTNYITDHTLPTDASIGYNTIIITWGELLLKNDVAINAGTFNFSPIKTLRENLVINGPSDVKIKIGPVVTGTTGNSDPAVIKATELIKDKQPDRPPTINPSSGPTGG